MAAFFYFRPEPDQIDTIVASDLWPITIYSCGLYRSLEHA